MTFKPYNAHKVAGQIELAGLLDEVAPQTMYRETWSGEVRPAERRDYIETAFRACQLIQAARELEAYGERGAEAALRCRNEAIRALLEGADERTEETAVRARHDLAALNGAPFA